MRAVVPVSVMGDALDWSLLIEAARNVRKHAYAPYSHFYVGAALLTEDGRVFAGCNVENASYGATQCAERTALGSAIAAGVSRSAFAALAIIGDTPEPLSPCGICRQVIHELCPSEMPIVLANLGGDQLSLRVKDLLPHAFSHKQLHMQDKNEEDADGE